MKHFTVHVLDHGLNFIIDPAGPCVLGVWQGDPLPRAIVMHRLAASPSGLSCDGETFTLDAPALVRLRAWVDQRSGLKQAAAKRRRLRAMFQADAWSNAMLEAFDRLDAGTAAPGGEPSYVQGQVLDQLRTAYEAMRPVIAARLAAAYHWA